MENNNMNSDTNNIEVNKMENEQVYINPNPFANMPEMPALNNQVVQQEPEIAPVTPLVTEYQPSPVEPASSIPEVPVAPVEPAPSIPEVPAAPVEPAPVQTVIDQNVFGNTDVEVSSATITKEKKPSKMAMFIGTLICLLITFLLVFWIITNFLLL